MKINWKVLIASLIIVYCVAFIGSIFTSQNTNSEWYESIKPAVTPPNYVFPIVWNILFFLIALSLYFVWVNAKRISISPQNKRERSKRLNRSNSKYVNIKTKIILVFGINFILNILWSILFFTLENPTLAFFELILLWASILYLVIFTYKINKISSYLLIPYLLWVSFAGILNWLSIK